MKAKAVVAILILSILLVSGLACGGGSEPETTPTPTPTLTPTPGSTPTHTYEARFTSYGQGQSTDIYRNGELLGRFWAGAVYLDAALVCYDAQGWSVDLDNLLPQHEWFEAYLNVAPDESPWREISYIHNTYSPNMYSHTGNTEAAAIQLAIWKWIYGQEMVTSGETDVEARALEIYDSAVGQTGVLPLYIGPVLNGIQHTIVTACELPPEPTPTPTPQATPTPTPEATPTPTPEPTRAPSRCELDRDAVQVALDAYHDDTGEWPTADGQPGDIEWDELVPGFLDGVPSTDSKCDWQVNSDPEGDVCLWKKC